MIIEPQPAVAVYVEWYSALIGDPMARTPVVAKILHSTILTLGGYPGRLQLPSGKLWMGAELCVSDAPVDVAKADLLAMPFARIDLAVIVDSEPLMTSTLENAGLGALAKCPRQNTVDLSYSDLGISES